MNNTAKPAIKLVEDIKSLIDNSKQQVAQTVNATLTLLYWKIGKRINQEILQNQRADYGKQVVAALSRQLSNEYGNGFSEKNLRRIIQFAEVFPDEQIVVSAIRQLSWTHFIALIPLKQPLEREFYAEMCRLERWSVKTLREKISGMLYERTAISNKPVEMIKQELAGLRANNEVTPDLVFKDPYILDFLGLKDTYSEKDVETSILAELQRFIIELGSDFAFLARQKRIQIDDKDFYIDLLFYHRRLKCLVAIDLKLGEFEAGFKGQMELYLRWLEKHEQQPGENTPIGLILCTGKNHEQIELLQLDKSGIKIAEYLTELPEKKLLQEKLHKAVEVSKIRMDMV